MGGEWSVCVWEGSSGLGLRLGRRLHRLDLHNMPPKCKADPTGWSLEIPFLPSSWDMAEGPAGRPLSRVLRANLWGSVS